MAVVAIANTSTWIQGGIEYDAYVSGSNIVVNVRFYMRRTNVYSDITRSSDITQYICISGDPNNWNYSQTDEITVYGGQQNVWQGPYFTASRTFDASRGGSTIYVGWKTVDNLGYPYLSGSGNTTITLPSAVSPPTGLAASNIVRNVDSFTADVSITSWGSGGASADRYLELQCWTYDASGFVQPRRYQPYYTSNLSATITVNNSSRYTEESGPLTITPNTMYTIGAYATNGAVATGSQRVGGYTTLAMPAELSLVSQSGTSATLSYSIAADGGKYDKTIQYSLDGGTTWITLTTATGGSAVSGTFTLSNLVFGNTYNILTKTTTNAGDSISPAPYVLYLPLHRKTYGSVSGVATDIDTLYGPVDNQGTTESALITKFYGPSGSGNTATLIHQSFGHLDYGP